MSILWGAVYKDVLVFMSLAWTCKQKLVWLKYWEQEKQLGEMLNVPEKGRVQIMEDIGQIIRFQFHYE